MSATIQPPATEVRSGGYTPAENAYIKRLIRGARPNPRTVVDPARITTRIAARRSVPLSFVQRKLAGAVVGLITEVGPDRVIGFDRSGHLGLTAEAARAVGAVIDRECR